MSALLLVLKVILEALKLLTKQGLFKLKPVVKLTKRNLSIHYGEGFAKNYFNIFSFSRTCKLNRLFLYSICICFSLFAFLIKAKAGAADTIRYSGSTTFCEGGSLLLTANNALSGATFQWAKDGNDIANATLVNYTATVSGDYTVKVNNSLYPALIITVNPKPVANFTFNPNNQCANVPINFYKFFRYRIKLYMGFWRFQFR